VEPGAPEEPLVDWKVGWLVVLALVVGGGFVLGRHLHWGRTTDAPLRALVAALGEGDDATAYDQMSARYRDAHTLADFQRAVAAMTELRSAEGIALDRPTLAAWEAPAIPDHLCGLLREVDPPSFVAATVIEEGGRFVVDALAVEARQLDPERPADRRRCQPTHGVWR